MKFMATSRNKRGEIYIYDAITSDPWYGGISAKTFSESLGSLKDVEALDIYINSPGGEVFDGIAIYNQLKRWSGEKIVHIDGIAASIASVIAMAGDEIRIAENGQVMIHDPWTFAYGTADDMRKAAESLDATHESILSTYVARTGGDREKINDLMHAETWMTSDKALEMGFVTKIVSNVAAEMELSALALLNKYRHTPDNLRTQASGVKAKMARMSMRMQQLRGASPKKK